MGTERNAWNSQRESKKRKEEYHPQKRSEDRANLLLKNEKPGPIRKSHNSRSSPDGTRHLIDAERRNKDREKSQISFKTQMY